MISLRHRLSRLWLPVALAAAFLYVAPAIAGWIEDRVDPETGETTTVIHVKLFALPDPTRTDTPSRADVAVVKEFVRRFPTIFARSHRDKAKANPDLYGRHNWDNVDVQLHRFSGITVEGVESALLAIAGGVSPDVMYVNFRQSHTYISQGFLYPLDKPEDEYLTRMTEDEKNFRIHPKIWPVIDRKAPSGEKHVWAIPYGGALGKVVLYRKDLFDEAGVPYPRNDWTWEDFLHACKRMTDPAKGIYGLYLGRGKHESWWWMTFLWSAGGDALVYDEETDEWRAVFDSRDAAVALEFYNRLCTERWADEGGTRRYGYCYRDPDWGTLSAKWSRGEIGMMFAYIDEKVFQKINPDVTGMAPVPIGPTGIRGGEINSMMMGLFAGIDHPAVRDTAWEYVKFFDCKDAVRIRTGIMVEGGLGRFINPRYLKMFGYEEIIRLAPKGWKECFEIALESGTPEPYGKNSNYAYDIMTKPIQEAEQLALEGKLPRDRQQRLDVLQGLLAKARHRADEQMLGILTPEQRLQRRISAALMLIAIIIAFSLVFRRISKAFTPPQTTRLKQSSWGFRKHAWAYVLLLPAALTIFVWQYIPLARGSVMAFQDYKIMGGSTLVWLDNFGDVLWDTGWWAAVWNSVRYSLLVIALTFLPPVVLAILLQEVPRGKILFRTIFYLPAVITGLVVILLWKSFYDPSERGALNAILLKIPAIGYLALGAILFFVAFSFAQRLLRHRMIPAALGFLFAAIMLFYTCFTLAKPIFAIPELSLFRKLFTTLPEPYRWLGDSNTAMFCCVLPMVWAGMGPGCLIYLAALKGIADDFYEAADMDGATFIDKILFIVFPILKPLLIINFVGVFIGSWLYATANILAMTGGAAGTEVAGLHIFYKAFIFLKFGPATAMAWVLGFMLIGFTVYQLQILSRLEFKTTGEAK